MAKSVYIIEGIDGIGKDLLIEGILQKLGYYAVIHFSKPKKLAIYEEAVGYKSPAQLYQEESFRNAMLLLNVGARLIYNRSWVGEAVYSELYRGYSGNYVFELEERFNLDWNGSIQLILLTEDFETSQHFVSDGESFDDSKRQEEQRLFVQAFNRSIVMHKKIVCVTDKSTGKFRPKEDILEEALYD